MKNILVLTDFSERARAASVYALQLASSIRANVVLCHALEITEQLTYPLADHLNLRNQTMKRLKEVGIYLQQFQPQNDEDYKPSITYVNDLDMIAEVAQKVIDNHSVQLVVIGSPKSHGFSRFFSGSHTNNILDHVKCPVLLVPEYAEFKPIRSIAYATDLTFDNSAVISYLATLAEPFNSEISVTHISVLDMPLTFTESEIEESIIEQLYDSKVQLTYRTIKGDNVPKGLLALSDAEKVDILTLVHKRYDFFGGLLHSSVSKQMAQTTKIPLLVMPYVFSLSEPMLTPSH
jgi:nucleotide-binding universal stress UspA family protein